MKSMAYRNVKKQKQLLLVMGVVAGAVLLSIGLGAVVFLSGQKQDLRQQASGSDYVGCSGGTIKEGGSACSGSRCMKCVAGTLVSANPRECTGMPCGFKITPTVGPTRVPTPTTSIGFCINPKNFPVCSGDAYIVTCSGVGGKRTTSACGPAYKCTGGPGKAKCVPR